MLALVAGLALPALGNLLSRRSLDASVARLAGEIARIRQDAITMRRQVGMVFTRSTEGDLYTVYVDGGRRGIRTAEIASGLDLPLRGPFAIDTALDGVRLGIPGPVPIPRIPPARGLLLPGTDPVRFGRADIISFSPIGESSSGTLYLTDRRGELRALVVYGRSGRIRVWTYSPQLHWRRQ
jgi:hypothetical protein